MKPLTDSIANSIAKVICLMLLLLSIVTSAFAQNQLPTAPTKRAFDIVRSTSATNTEAKNPWDEVWSNMRTSFALPVEDIGKKPGIFVGSINAWVPLRAVFPLAVPLDPANPSTQGPPPNNLLAFASATYFPLGYWFLNFSYFQFIGRKEVLPWHPDFTYSFGYNDWHMYTFSLIYGNYGGNRFAPDASKGEQVTRFDQGTWSLGFKFPAPQFLRSALEFHPTSNVQHLLNLNVIPSYYNVSTSRYEQWQTFLSLQTRYNIYDYFFGLLTLFYYPSPAQQQPWNPDFTYGFGYANWNSFTVSVQYNNYSGNRFPWNKPAENTGNFLDGIFSVSFNITL